MIDRSKLNIPLGFNVNLKYEDLFLIMKSLRTDYFRSAIKSELKIIKRVHNDIVIQTGIGVAL